MSNQQKGKIEPRLLDGIWTYGKNCLTCGIWKTLEEGFSKQKLGLGGRRASCKLCDKAYRAANKDRLSEYNQKYRQNNQDKIKQYKEENKKKIKEQEKKYRELHRDKRMAYSREWRQRNRERHLSNYRKWSLENKEYLKEYRRITLPRTKLQDQKRRARKKLLDDGLSFEQRNLTLKKFNYGCALTGDKQNLHFDHVIPISIGHGGTTYGNMIPLRGDLNLSKSDSNIFLWFETNKQRLNLSQEKFVELVSWLADVNGVSKEDYRDHVFWCHENPQDFEDIKQFKKGSG